MKMRWLLILLGVPATVLFFLYMVGSNPKARDESWRRPQAIDEKARARSAISLCWEEYERKSLDPQTKRFIAGACEQMERDFVAKFKHKP